MEESPVAAPAPRGAAAASRAFLMMLARENLVLALGMGAITLVAQLMEELPPEPLSPLIVALAFYAVYSLDRAGAAPHWPAAAAMGGFLFGRWWINTLVFDLRDEAGDRANGLRTVPVVLGRARTLRLLHAGNAALAATIAVPLFGWARPLFALLAASSVYVWIYLRALAAGGDPHFLCDVVADGELLLLSALVLLATL